MQKNNRQYKRYDLPLIVKFRTPSGETPFSLGLTKNMSFDGLSIESRDFTFIKNKDLEMELKLPQNGSVISLLGNVVWKMETGKTSRAGINLNAMSNETKKQMIDRITEYSNIPFENPARTNVIVKKIKKSSRVKEVLKQAVKKVRHEPSPDRKGVTKDYRKDSSLCRVTFTLPMMAAPESQDVRIVGDFNQWDREASPMKRLKNGDFLITLDLKSRQEYRFRYLINGNQWENDWNADRYVPNDFGSDDSVVIV